MIGILILNWNNAPATIRCMEAVAELDADFALYLIDNASTDGSRESLARWLGAHGRTVDRLEFHATDRRFVGPTVRLPNPGDTVFIASDQNLGYGGGNNIGLGLAFHHGARGMWVLNNDTRPEPGALRAILGMAVDSSVGIIGSTILEDDGSERVQSVGGGRYDWMTSRSTLLGNGLRRDEAATAGLPTPDFISGAAMFLTRDLLADIGAFEEAYHLYCEEIDLAERARRQGWHVAVAHGAVVRHAHGATAGSSTDLLERSLVSYYYGSKSPIVMTRKLRARWTATVVAARLGFAATLAARGLHEPARAVRRAVRDGLSSRPIGDLSFRAVDLGR